MMTCAALVLFMTLPGLALFYGGLVRSEKRPCHRRGPVLRHLHVKLGDHPVGRLAATALSSQAETAR